MHQVEREVHDLKVGDKIPTENGPESIVRIHQTRMTVSVFLRPDSLYGWKNENRITFTRGEKVNIQVPG